MSTDFSTTFQDIPDAVIGLAPTHNGQDAGGAMEALDLASDLDASLRFIADHKNDIRYSPELGWLVWDGKRWKADVEGRVRELAKISARNWLLRAAAGDAVQDKPDHVRAAIRLESTARIEGAVRLASSAEAIVVTHERLDRDGWLLNVNNGTLDLHTGRLRPHSREDLITKLAPVDYIPGATHPALDAFLGNLTPEKASFLQRVCGMTLTADCEAESLFLNQGPGNSGKTTLAESMAAVLGDYCAKVAFESLCTSKYGRAAGAATPDLVVLRGARMAYASEGAPNAKLDSGLVKQLTGCERVVVRPLYKAPFAIEQTWKLWLFTNHDPKTDSEDDAIWRRMLKIESHAIPEEKRDPAVKRALTNAPDAKAAVLAWAVRGCLDWVARGSGRKGLGVPVCVKDATENYRRNQDSLGEWWRELEATAEFSLSSRVKNACLWKHYLGFCENEGGFEVSAKRWRTYCEGKGLQRGRDSGGSIWRGVELPE